MESELLRINDELRSELRELRLRVEELEAENARLKQQLVDAKRQIGELERANARQAAPFRRRESKKVPPEKKKRSGRKPGHRGACRAVPPQVDLEIEVPLRECPCCGGAVEDRSPLVQYIEEIPPVRPQVIRLTTWHGECLRCGRVHSSHPLKTSTAGGAAQVQLGPRALALAALLNKRHGLTMRTTCEVLKKVLGLSITPGGLSQALDRVADKVESQYDALIEKIRGSRAVFADETSWWVDGPSWWLWTFTTEDGTLYRVDKSRGSQVVREVLGDEFAGMLVSDCLASYDPVDYRKHKCIAHHLRAIAKARDQPHTPDPSYLDRWKVFFKTVSILYGLRPLLSDEDFAAKRAHLENTCKRLLDEPRTQPGDVAVQKRLLKQWPHLLGCLYEPAAEPTNNRAERALRPAVIARKVSCGNRTPRGKRTWEILASLGATCAQNAIDFVDYLVPHLPLAPHAG